MVLHVVALLLYDIHSEGLYSTLKTYYYGPDWVFVIGNTACYLYTSHSGTNACVVTLMYSRLGGLMIPSQC